MSSAPRQVWGGSLHQTFRLLPEPSPNLLPFLSADGSTPDEVLDHLPYDAARAGGGARTRPDPKRYRDGKQVYQTAGLLYEGDDDVVHVTSLGVATRRWIPIITAKNAPILGRHAAYALAACQLRNPTGAGEHYDQSLVVFPFAFIWRVMLGLDNRINSDELNRAVFKIKNASELPNVINRIAAARASGSSASLGVETIVVARKDDRIIPWMSLASFGWTLIADKNETGDGYYRIRPEALDVVSEAAAVVNRHHDFASVGEYVGHVARAASLPPDLG